MVLASFSIFDKAACCLPCVPKSRLPFLCGNSKAMSMVEFVKAVDASSRLCVDLHERSNLDSHVERSGLTLCFNKVVMTL